MKKISESHPISIFNSNQLRQYFDDMQIGIFDIETLGLNPITSPVILAGLMTVDNENQCTITQYFAESMDDEKEILECLREDYNKLDYVLTYNGKHFDLPYIAKRAAINSVSGIESSMFNLDLYLILNGHSEIKDILENLKQKTVEKYMGLEDSRADKISGADSVLMYQEYINIRLGAKKGWLEKSELEKNILLHNHDDLLQLAQLLPILRQVNLHKAFYSLGFPVMSESGWPNHNITSIKLTSTGLMIMGKYYGEPFSYASFESVASPFSCEFKEDKTFSFRLRIDRHKGNTFINLPAYFKDYDYFKKYPNFLNNFLLINNSSSTNYLEVNMFVKRFLKKFMEDHICPAVTL